jgi:hypothetical protein
MKECTLKEAIELCKKNGGVMYKKDLWGTPQHEKYYYMEIQDEFVVSWERTGRRVFTPTEITAVWIYEPPKQSAFHKWVVSLPSNLVNADKLRKEGWNAAIDEVLKLERNPARSISDINEIHPAMWEHQIKELKE